MPTSINSWNESGIFFNSNQRPHQSVEEFCEEVHRLTVPLKKGEQDIKDAIIHGLLTHIRQLVLKKDHNTLAEVVQSAIVHFKRLGSRVSHDSFNQYVLFFSKQCTYCKTNAIST